MQSSTSPTPSGPTSPPSIFPRPSPSSTAETGDSAGFPAPPGEPSERTRLGLGILAAAVALGVVGDALLRAEPWGVNATLCIWTLVAAIAALVRWRRIPMTADAPWLALTALLLGAAFVRRDSGWLQFFDLVAMAGVLALTVLAARGTALRGRTVLDYCGAAGVAMGGAAVGVFRLVFGDIRWAEIPLNGRLRVLKSVGVGTLIAVPLLVVFGALFASADAVFAGVLRNVFFIEPERVAEHVLLTGFFAWLAAGYLGVTFLPAPAGGVPFFRPGAPPSLGIIPVATALGLVSGLFLLFVVVQLRYLFGGEAVVLETTGLTLAEYARSGFFELVTVSALVLPVLLGADGLLRNEGAAGRRTFRQLAGLLLVLLGVVMASALERMRLYVAEFGLSEDRLYATAFMAYLAILFAWFAFTALRERQRRFAFGGVIQGLAVLAGLHVLNPDALIARVNLDRAIQGNRFDAEYLAHELSADAVPVLLERISGLSPERSCDLTTRLLNRWTKEDSGDWRSWNWSRAEARRLVRERRATLEAAGCPPLAESRRPS